MESHSKSKLQVRLRRRYPLKPVTTATQKAGNGKRLITEGNSLVAANLPVGYGRALAVLAAEEGVTKKDLMQEAFDLLFKARGRAPL